MAIDERPVVAFLGPEGTFTHQVAYERFGDSVQYVSKQTIADVYHAVPSGAQIAVLPKENSIFGSVIETYDLLRMPEVGTSKLIREQVSLRIEHCLLVAKGTQLEDVRRVYSHEQALGQCSKFLHTRLPIASLHKMPSTAAAASMILDAEFCADSAAICSAVCTTLFTGLDMLEKGIQNEKYNETRFLVASMSGADIPGLVPSKASAEIGKDRNALLRISWPVNSTREPRPQLLRCIEHHVVSVDRRPSLDPTPFHDVYFVQLKAARSGRESVEVEWESEVKQTQSRLLAAGWNVEVLGIW